MGLNARFCSYVCGVHFLLATGGVAAQADDYKNARAPGNSYYMNLLISRSQSSYMKERAARAATGKRSPEPEAPGRPGVLGTIRAPYAEHVRAASRAANVDAALIHAVILVESGYNPSARSGKGAVGLMQLMPDTAKRYGVLDRLDPAQNIHAGARYLRDLQLMFHNDIQLVLAAYNAGENAVVKYGNRIPPYAETIAYVPQVISQYRRYRVQY